MRHVRINELTHGQTTLAFEARRGIIESFSVAGKPTESPELIGRNIHDIIDWTAPLREAGVDTDEVAQTGKWLNGIMGVEFTNLR